MSANPATARQHADTKTGMGAASRAKLALAALAVFQTRYTH